ncbi:hypothetical protein RGF97_09595 [Streptomyces roseicoloratus]|uniref:Uncharacterized protein n=1 Tax=Streptomyces roseicoloratus TaxID=2508722 RepID=A0ABY9RSA1_9ACTN|nr:hypothetical protein [Streptomyces roseicoloratus]WMX45055.1 hypothetical protein RGF97_09595 [Streptomyces roseicoloratus]
MESARREASVEAIRDAKAARDELRSALLDVDIVLPSLGLDTVSLASPYTTPLVDLGRCRPDVARQLASLLRGCAG